MICREAHALCIVFVAMLLGLILTAGAVASMDLRPAHWTESHAPIMLNAEATAQHECSISTGSSAGHCHLPSTVPGNGSGNETRSAEAFGSQRILLELLRGTQHRPSGLLRPPDVLSRTA